MVRLIRLTHSKWRQRELRSTHMNRKNELAVIVSAGIPE
jgi:hypothetical protein